LWSRENFNKFTFLARRRMATLPRPPLGMDAPGVVAEAARLLIDGTRRGRIEYALEAVIVGVIDSLIYHGAKHPENLVPLESLDAVRDEDHAPAEPASPELSPEEAFAAREQLETFKTTLPDDLHRRFVDLVSSGECPSAVDAAVMLDVPESRIRSMVKLVRRRRPLWPGRPRKTRR
jgi:hypothetical protein